ncbi:hypothetical protein AQPE_0419 [Aquipluma nitroreducens]|uniref:Uncharacterized protein n=1 Tax=Aquipluma nitroreducens TaxID=2010828 RepID=A0A5K7S412_9BACT|nr:hypothetical protein [Aquipluma nitroreducens]BBE16282.1 hypothetical protein AQPE_0419 [Aquipluma nitroreducens]
MSSILQNIISLFCSSKVDIRKIKEEYDQVEIIITSQDCLFPNASDFAVNLKNLNDRDILHISIRQDDEILENFSTSGNNSFDEFVSKYSKKYNRQIPIEIKLTVVKETQTQIISVYYFDQFIEYLKSLSVVFFLSVIKKNLKNGEILFFELQDKSITDELITNSIIISAQKGFKQQNLSAKRLERNSQIRTVCNCNLLPKYDFIPEDFYPIKESGNSNLDNLFKLISTIYSVIFLFDIVNIETDNIDFKLNGYKTIFKNFKLSSIDIPSFDYYFKIYDWVYEGGSIIDKIGLARNIISLNVDQNDLKIPETTFHAIQSGFKIYQKENIKQYIEIRNKISDQLIEIQNKADKIVEDFINDFKRSLFTFVSFFASVLVLKVVSKGDLTGGFSKGVTYLSIGFLLISLIIMFFRLGEIKKQKKRYKDFYLNMKNRYLDLLDKSDIERILNKDHDFKENLKYINCRVKNYVWIWSLSTLVLFIAVVCLYNP